MSCLEPSKPQLTKTGRVLQIGFGSRTELNNCIEQKAKILASVSLGDGGGFRDCMFRSTKNGIHFVLQEPRSHVSLFDYKGIRVTYKYKYG